MKPAYFTHCRGCETPIVILTTKRGKRIAVNQHPVGHEAYKFRGVTRLEELYIYGTHQPHVVTCTKPLDKNAVKKKKFV